MEIQQQLQHHHQEAWSNSESTRIGYSGRLSGPFVSDKRKSSKKNASFKDDDKYEEIILGIPEDSVSVQNIRGGESEDAYLTGRLEKRTSFGSKLSFRLRQVSQQWKHNTSSKFNKEDRTQSAAARALRGLKFMTKNVGNEGWSEIEKRFHELAVDSKLPKTRFDQCIGIDSKTFAGELFDALAQRRGITSASISKEELREFWEQITDKSFDSRLQTFFDMVDKNADGRITKEEVKEIIALSASDNKLSKIKERAEEYANFFMEELDKNRLGYIGIYNLEMLFLQVPAQSTHLNTNSRVLEKMLSKKLVPTKEFNPVKRCLRWLTHFIVYNWKRIWVINLWLGICAALFAWKFMQYKHRDVFQVMGYCVTTAKGAAETLKLNMAIVLLPVCRNTITWLRSRTKLGSIVPFDDNMNFHKVIACGIAIGVGIHAISHLTCDFPRLLHATDAEYEPMKPFFGDTRPNNYGWFLKGTDGWTGIVMVVLMAIAFTLAQPSFRRNTVKLPKALKRLTGFNAFWYSHHLFVIVYALFIVHGYFIYLQKKWYRKTTWMYLAVPVLLYACERLIRTFRSRHKTVKILKVTLYPGEVLALHVSRPQGFKYTSGQYIYVKCSDISPFEWHPFSITSAPGNDYVSVHIRNKGDWTSQLMSIFAQDCQPSAKDQSGLLRADIGRGNNVPRMPKVLIDGPYGAPSQDYTQYEVLLLVGLGIGATPFISILKDVVNNIKLHQDLEQGLENGGVDKRIKIKPFVTKRALFYWVTPEPDSFDWFRRVMDEVVENDTDGVIELYNHCTSVYEEGDARSAFITMLQSLYYAKSGVDIVSGTRTKTHFGRPKWRDVFKRVAMNHTGQRVGVFYCGPPGLVRTLTKLSQEFSTKNSTKFVFHKENF